jgi:hypothetical protein
MPLSHAARTLVGKSLRQVLRRQGQLEKISDRHAGPKQRNPAGVTYLRAGLVKDGA